MLSNYIIGDIAENSISQKLHVCLKWNVQPPTWTEKYNFLDVLVDRKLVVYVSKPFKPCLYLFGNPIAIY